MGHPVPPLIASAFAALVCLAPFTFYLCWLAAVNRRPRPTVVAGPWDFVGLFAALFGFVLVGGYVLLNSVFADSRLLARGNFNQVQLVWAVQGLAWSALLTGYFALVAAVVAAGVGRRRNTLSVYNVGEDQLIDAVDEAMQRAGIPGIRRGNRWACDGPVDVLMTYFHGMRHGTVRVATDRADLRAELKRHIRAGLASTEAADNPAAGWLRAGGTIGVLSLFAMLGGILALQFLRF